MDGVLADFNKRYNQLFPNHNPAEDWSKNWEVFVKEENFKTLEWHAGAEKLFDYVKKLRVPYEILSSSGGELYYDEIKAQKTFWLNERGFDCPINIVPGKEYKKDYAKQGYLLVDDSHDVVDEFRKAGGFAILHYDVIRTLDQLDLFNTGYSGLA